MLDVTPANERQNAGRLEGVLDGPERSDVGCEHASKTPSERSKAKRLSALGVRLRAVRSRDCSRRPPTPLCEQFRYRRR